jgi:hypothetical protein
MASARLLLSALVVAIPAGIGAASNAPRFTVQPGPGGATRVDTQTGAISHCTPRDGAWHCEPAMPAPIGDPERVSEAINALAARVDAISARLDRIASGEGAAGAAGEAPPRRALPAEVVDRFLQMVRRLKHRLTDRVTPDAS